MERKRAKAVEEYGMGWPREERDLALFLCCTCSHHHFLVVVIMEDSCNEDHLHQGIASDTITHLQKVNL